MTNTPSWEKETTGPEIKTTVTTETRPNAHLPVYEATPGNFHIRFPEGRFSSTTLSVDLLTERDMDSINKIFDEILSGKTPDSTRDIEDLRERLLAGDAADADGLNKLQEEIHRRVENANKTTTGYTSYHDLKLFFSELLSHNTMMGDHHDARIARVNAPNFISEQFPMTFQSNAGNEIEQNAPAAKLEQVFVVTAADGERLKQIIRQCHQADQVAGDLNGANETGIDSDHDGRAGKLMIKVRGVRLGFVFYE